MMAAKYPPEITFTDYDLQPGLLERSSSTLSGGGEKATGVSGCQEKELDADLVRLWLVDDESFASSNNSFSDTHDPIPSDSYLDRFNFAPGDEEFIIRWEIEGEGISKIRGARLELICKTGGRPKKIWTKNIFWDEGKCPERGDTPFGGCIGNTSDLREDEHADSVTITKSCAPLEFTDDYLSAEHSPYKLKVTLLDSPGVKYKNSVRWLYFDVRIAGIELEWPESGHVEKILPNTNKDRNLRLYELLTDEDDDDNLNGALPADGETKKVPLRSHAFYRTESELTDHTYYERYKALWGDGPSIPVFAAVRILDSGGNAVDAPHAVGKCHFLWEWLDKGAADWPGGDANIKTWLDNARNYKAAATSDSPQGKNCHVDRGGKRGLNARTCFPKQNGKDPALVLPDHDGSDQVFPFKVAPCNTDGSPFTTTRRWCAFSESWGSGLLMGKTGVLFQPSRIAGDGYELHCYMAYDTDNAMENEINPDNVPDGLHVASGTFQVWRQMEILKHWRLRTESDTGALIDLSAVQEKFKKYYIDLRIPDEHVDNIDNWFDSLEGVVTGNTLPDYMREAIDLTNQERMVPIKTYEEWRTRMEVLHGTGDTLYAWAENVPNMTGQSGNVVWFSWESHQGNNGLTPLIRPWPLHEYTSVDKTNLGAGKVEIIFPFAGDGGKSIELEFTKQGRSTNRGDTLTDEMRNQIKPFLGNVIRYTLERLGHPFRLVSYRHPRAPSRGDHTRLLYQLKGRATKGRHMRRFENIRAALPGLVEATCYDESKSNFTNKNIRNGWVFTVFDEVINTMLDEEFEEKSGLVALQATDLTNYQIPTGKAFYASQGGKRALAACLKLNPHQRTAEHEIGHAMFLNHTYQTQWQADPNFYHQKERPSNGNCIMHYMPTNGCTDDCLFCGFCIARIWGWSVQTADPITGDTANPRTLYYHENYNKDPGAPVDPLPHPRTEGEQHSTNLVV